jgi:hypothetical protein
MKTPHSPAKSKSVWPGTLSQQEAPVIPKTHPIKNEFTTEDSKPLLFQGQTKQYFIPSTKPLWINPLNDF